VAIEAIAEAIADMEREAVANGDVEPQEV
jgi:hypothetical protein